MRISRRTKYWIKCREELKKEFERRGIIRCECQFPRCHNNNFLGFAHRHKRRWYYDKPELLKSFNQVILACNQCHNRLEQSRELTELTFKRLRGNESI